LGAISTDGVLRPARQTPDDRTHSSCHEMAEVEIGRQRASGGPAPSLGESAPPPVLPRSGDAPGHRGRPSQCHPLWAGSWSSS